MNDASKSRKSLPAPHETPNTTAPVRGKGVAPLSCTPTMENGLGSSVLLPDHSLRCQSVKNTRRRGGVNKRHITNTTSLQPPTTQNSSHHPQHRTHLQAHPSPPSTTRRRVGNHPPSLTKHPTLQPQYAGRGWRLFHVRPWTEDALRHSVFLPDHSLRHRRMKSTLRRGGV